MSDAIYAVFGASGFGREVMPLVRQQLQSDGVPQSDIYFVDDSPQSDMLNGHVVLSYPQFLLLTAVEKYVVVAISDASIRTMITERCYSDGLSMLSVEAANTFKMDNVLIGEGSILCPFVTLTSNIRIGKGFQANIYSYVAHDCVIGDYVTFAPAVKCNGNIVIGNNAYIGTGAIIKQGQQGKPLVIGKGAVVGMGAVVTKNVADGAIVVGNPAKPLRRVGLGGK